MKISQACEMAGLTERAVRLYVKEGLVLPGQHNGRMDFSQQDIEKLQRIALFRRYGFSIRQILRMQDGSDQVRRVLEERKRELEAETMRAAHLLPVLEWGLGESACSADALAERMAQLRKSDPAPDFSRFDEETPLEKERLQTVAWSELTALEKRRRMIRRSIPWMILLAVALFFGIAIHMENASRETDRWYRVHDGRMQQKVQEILQIRATDKP